MQATPDLVLSPPTLPKGGGAIQSIGKGLGAIGTSGAASFSLALPISPGRSLTPAIDLIYSSGNGNGPFGIGWNLTISSFSRRTSGGVPHYQADDEIVGPDGNVMLPERDTDGSILSEQVEHYNGMPLGQCYTVVRYWPRVEATFARVEYWQPLLGIEGGFWLVHSADGLLHLYGKRSTARISAPVGPGAMPQIAQWLLEETVDPYGQHILYEYREEDASGLKAAQREQGRDCSRERYLSRVCYGDPNAHAPLYLWHPATLPAAWHFELHFDYGERTTDPSQAPSYTVERDWLLRIDPLADYRYGFERRSLRLCRQVLMFHCFAQLGPQPQLVKRLLLEYREDPACSQLLAAHQMAYPASGPAEYLPPMEFDYSRFSLDPAGFSAMEGMPGLNDGELHQLVDLYGEGLPGMLYRSDQEWRYRSPVRAVDGGDTVAYGPPQTLPQIPAANSISPLRQVLTDLTGDGRLDWVIAQPGMAGFFTLNPDQSWSTFMPLGAFPLEFFHPQSQLADLVGAGLADLALIGSRSVRLYANRREQGFAVAEKVARSEQQDRLPQQGDGRVELVAFADILGSGQVHLLRIRHNEIRCWPNLGHGRFGQSFRFAELDFDPARFDPTRVHLTDLDGSGAVDLIYLESRHARIFVNLGGNGLAAGYRLPWPDGVQFDGLCQLSSADLQGLGCASLVLTVPHMSPRHWRCDFVPGQKPYLLQATNNNMGNSSSVRLRSSAQEWLDEKAELQAAGKSAVSYLPFPVHVVVAQTQLDEISGTTLSQAFQYRRGHYDGQEREFRGFGLLLHTDSELPAADAPSSQTAPVLTKTWFHTGRIEEASSRDGFYDGDREAPLLGPPPFTRFVASEQRDHIIDIADQATQRALAYALSGRVRRVEVFGLDHHPDSTVPYTVSELRYLVRHLEQPSRQQRYLIVLPLTVEVLSLRYERNASDPLCQREVNLRWDEFGTLTHGVQINYARRDSATARGDYHDRQWWAASHDAAQEAHYLTEQLSQAIHLPGPQAWRLGLRYRMRSNSIVLARQQTNSRLFDYEGLLGASSPLGNGAVRVLSALSMQRYQGCSDGAANFEALADYQENAELDQTALTVYEPLLSDAELAQQLSDAGYQRMAIFLPEDKSATLWSVHSGFATYAPASAFRRVVAFQPVRGVGITTATYDAYHMQLSMLTDAAGCTTTIHYDYRSLLPVHIVDPNQNIQEARYDAFGRLQLNSFYGTEGNATVRVGFDPLDQEVTPITLEQALQQPAQALQGAAMRCCYASFSWMGQLPAHFAGRSTLLKALLEQGWSTPDGHLRARARGWPLSSALSTVQQALRMRLAPVLTAILREPVHSATLQADRYPHDGEPAQIRINLVHVNGFGRELQRKQKVPAGPAWVVNAQGDLVVRDEQPVQTDADPRWRVSARVEYNNKGLPIRVYRPYFADRHCYINDLSLRRFGYADQLYYDALGRQIVSVNAHDHIARQTPHGWYTVSEDENDTAAENLISDGEFAEYFRFWEKSSLGSAVISPGKYVVLSNGGSVSQRVSLFPRVRHYRLLFEHAQDYVGANGKARMVARPSGLHAELTLSDEQSWTALTLELTPQPQDTHIEVHFQGQGGETRIRQVVLLRKSLSM